VQDAHHQFRGTALGNLRVEDINENALSGYVVPLPSLEPHTSRM